MNFSPIYSVLCSSLHLSLRLPLFVFVFVFVCVCVNIFPSCSLHLSKSCSYQTSKRLKHIYASRKMMMTEFMPEHTPDSLRFQTVIYTKQNYSKGFEIFNFLHFALYRISKANKYVRAYRTWLLLYAKHFRDVRGNRSST